MSGLVTLVISTTFLINPGQPTVTGYVRHLDPVVCELRVNRLSADDNGLGPYVRRSEQCIPDAQAPADDSMAQPAAAVPPASMFKLRAVVTVDGREQPEMTATFQTLETCQAELTKAQEVVDAQRGRSTLDAHCEPQ